MEKSFLLRTDEYMRRLRTLGILIIVAIGLLNGSLNMTWNIKALEGRLEVTPLYYGTLLVELLLFFTLSFVLLEIILLRSPLVRKLGADAGKYKVTLSKEGVAVFLPIKEIGYLIPYSRIQKIRITESLTADCETVTIYADDLPLTKGDISFYISTKDVMEFRESFEGLSNGMRLRTRKEHLASSILLSYEMTKPIIVKLKPSKKS